MKTQGCLYSLDWTSGLDYWTAILYALCVIINSRNIRLSAILMCGAQICTYV